MIRVRSVTYPRLLAGLSCAVLVLAIASSAPAVASGSSGSGDRVVQGSVLPGTFHDTAVGDPAASIDGAVDVQENDGSRERITPQGLGLIDNAYGDRFGASVATAELNGDNDVDLVISAPGTAGQTPTATGVWILFGTGTGYDADHMVKLPMPATSPTPADDFGAALALTGRGDAGTDLWVGAPGTTVNGHADAGAIYHYLIAPSGTPSLVGTVTQDSPLVPGAAETGDRFGQILARAGIGVAVGVPDEDIGTATDAGEMVRLVIDVQSGLLNSRTAAWSQNSPGVPGVAEAYDHFGAAVADDGLMVGVPGEDLGDLKDAGLVQEFDYDNAVSTSGDVLKPGPAITQDTPAVKPTKTTTGSTAVPGTAEAGDEFGAAVAVGTFNCTEDLTAAIGSPGESIGDIAGAGTVTLWTPNGANSACPSLDAYQGKTFSGVPERGDHLGAALATVNGDPDADEDSFNSILVGVPGEDIGSTPDVGREIVWQPLYKRYAVYGPIGGDYKDQDFGRILSLDGPAYSISEAP